MNTSLQVKFQSRLNSSRVWYVVFDLGDYKENIKGAVKYAWDHNASIVQ